MCFHKIGVAGRGVGGFACEGVEFEDKLLGKEVELGWVRYVGMMM